MVNPVSHRAYPFPSMSFLIGLVAAVVVAAVVGCAEAPETPRSVSLVNEDFTRWTGRPATPGLEILTAEMPGTGVRDVPARAQQGVPTALVRNLAEVPRLPDDRLDIYRNEVAQGARRRFDAGVPFDHSEQALVIRTTSFCDAALTGTNSLAVRVWVQSGFGPNEHRERMELSTHFNAHARGSRQVYPNAYMVRDGWETWAMPEGTNGRRAGIYYRMAEQGRNEVIRGPEAVLRGYYWTWADLHWPAGWEEPLGGAMYEPMDIDDEGAAEELGKALGEEAFAVTAVFRRGDESLADLTGRDEDVDTLVDVDAPRHTGRVPLRVALPSQIDEVRILLRGDEPPERGWAALAPHADEEEVLLGVADVRVDLVPLADATLDGKVDECDWRVLREHFGRADDALMFHGDATGDGRVGMDDVMVMVRQWSSPDSPPPADLTDLQAKVGPQDGHLRVHLPADVPLYAFDLRAVGSAKPLLGNELRRVFGDESVSELDEARIGAARLDSPMVEASSEPRTVDLGAVIPADEASDRDAFHITLAVSRGREPVRVPVWQPEAEDWTLMQAGGAGRNARFPQTEGFFGKFNHGKALPA